MVEYLPLADDLSRIGPEEETEYKKEPSYQQEFGVCLLPQGVSASEAGALPAIERIDRVFPAVPLPDKINDHNAQGGKCQNHQQRDVRFEKVGGKVFVVLHQIVHPVDILTVRGISSSEAAAEGFNRQTADPAVAVGVIDFFSAVLICYDDFCICQKLILIKNLDILPFGKGYLKGQLRDVELPGGNKHNKKYGW